MIERWNEPVFIVGAPRSGTTLLRNMLNRHPQLAVFRDSNFWHFVYRRRRAFGNLDNQRNRLRLAEEYLSIRPIRRFQMDPQALAATVLREGDSYQTFLASILRVFAQSQGKSRFGDVTHDPLFTGTLCAWYPAGRIIHLVRDPRDVVESLMRLEWADQSVLGNAHLWLRCNVAARRFVDRQQYLLVCYERLATQPELELRRICDFIGEEYLPAMLVPNNDPSADRPWFQRAEEPVTTARLGRWREHLTADQLALIEWLVGRHMPTYGYEPAGHLPSKATIARALVSAAYDAARRRVREFPSILYSLPSSTRLAKEEAATERFRTGKQVVSATPKDCL